MNESLPPEGRRVSYKSLDSEAMAAARRAAEASGISLQEWLSRTILENARRSGLVPDDPSREVGSGQPSAEDAVQAIARHLERAKSAADAQGLSLAEWLSRAILTNASGPDAGAARRALLESDSPPRAAAPVDEPPLPEISEGDPPHAEAHARQPMLPPLPSRSARQSEAAEPELPEAATVRDVLSRGRPSQPVAAPRPRRRLVVPLAAAIGALLLVVGGLAVTRSLRSGDTTEAAAPAGESKSETAALPDAKPTEPTKPETPPPVKPESAKPEATQPPPAKPPETAKAPEKPADQPPAAAVPPPRPPEKADATPGTPSAPAKPATPPAAAAKPDSKPAEKPLPESADDLSKVPAKDMPKPASAHADWYKRAAEAENPDAQYALAELYLKGDGVPRDYRQAAALFRRAADKGNLARAQYALALLYQRGLGLQKNDVEAVLWFQKAADQNYLPAITWVGLSLLEGRGIPKDEEAARKMLERAAEGDEQNAQYTLGRLYERGQGVKKDPVVAMKWFILAAEQAHPQATQKVEELSTSLPRDLQERATGLVSEHYSRFRKRN